MTDVPSSASESSAVAIIPARGGSKRIPGKNTRPFLGKPIIEYSIRAAIESAIFTRVIVSTDSPHIGDIARAAGAEVPFVRPAELSDDHASTVDVLVHAIEWLREHGDSPKYVCCIYPAAPFVTAALLAQGHRLITDKAAPAAFTVTPFEAPVQRALTIAPDGTLRMLHPEHELSRTNDLAETYHDAGMFYWLDTRAFLETKRVFTPDALPLVVPPARCQDIDTEEDWVVAEAKARALWGPRAGD